MKKVFISYCWTSKLYQVKVMNFARKMIESGIEVVIDVWDLKPGQDMNFFMESMVRSKDISHVIILINKLYSEKADAREGGVGTESQIISSEIYSSVLQEKFIPVVMELKEDGTPYLPIFLKGRIYIDLSGNLFNDNFDQVIRHITGKLNVPKPSKININSEKIIHNKTVSVGDIYCDNGRIVNYKNLQPNDSPLGIIFYVNDNQCLILGFWEEQLAPFIYSSQPIKGLNFIPWYSSKRDYDGKQNTEILKRMFRTGSKLLDFVRAKGDEWYIPSLGEMELLYNNLHIVNSILLEMDKSLVRDSVLFTKYYWTSTFSSVDKVYIYTFSNSVSSRVYKNDESKKYRLRIIRKYEI